MNSWLKALTAGLLVALLVFFAGDKIPGVVSKKKLYHAEFSLHITAAATTTEKKNALLRTKRILEKRMQSAGFDYSFTSDTLIAGSGEWLIGISIRNIEDTLYPYELLRSNGLLQITEVYQLHETVLFLQALSEAAAKAYPPSSAAAAGSETTDLAPEIKELLDSIEHRNLLKENETYGLGRLLTLSTIPGGAEIGHVKEKDTAALGALLRMEKVQQSLPQDALYCYGRVVTKEEVAAKKNEKMMALYLLNTRGRSKAFLQNEDIEYAQNDFHHLTGHPNVFFQFTEKGSVVWENLTSRNIRRPLAILVNGEVITAPVVNETIKGGSCVINGDFTVTETKTMATLLSTEPLPAKSVISRVQVSRADSSGLRRKLLLSLLAFAVGSGLALLVFNTLKAT